MAGFIMNKLRANASPQFRLALDALNLIPYSIKKDVAKKVIKDTITGKRLNVEKKILSASKSIMPNSDITNTMKKVVLGERIATHGSRAALAGGAYLGAKGAYNVGSKMFGNNYNNTPNNGFQNNTIPNANLNTGNNFDMNKNASEYYSSIIEKISLEESECEIMFKEATEYYRCEIEKVAAGPATAAKQGVKQGAKRSAKILERLYNSAVKSNLGSAVGKEINDITGSDPTIKRIHKVFKSSKSIKDIRDSVLRDEGLNKKVVDYLNKNPKAKSKVENMLRGDKRGYLFPGSDILSGMVNEFGIEGIANLTPAGNKYSAVKQVLKDSARNAGTKIDRAMVNGLQNEVNNAKKAKQVSNLMPVALTGAGSAVLASKLMNKNKANQQYNILDDKPYLRYQLEESVPRRVRSSQPRAKAPSDFNQKKEHYSKAIESVKNSEG